MADTRSSGGADGTLRLDCNEATSPAARDTDGIRASPRDDDCLFCPKSTLVAEATFGAVNAAISASLRHTSGVASCAAISSSGCNTAATSPLATEWGGVN